MDYDVIVIGLGAMGAAAVEQLSRRGVSVLGIDQSSVPNTRGSSAGDTRLIRKAYFEHPDYVPLLERAYHHWRDLEARTGERLLYTTGALYIGPPEGDLIAGSLRAAREHDLALLECTPEDLERLHPQFTIPSGYVAGYEPEAGFVMAGGSIAALATASLNQGAQLLAHTRVDSWRAGAGGIQVMSGDRTFRAGKLIIAGGSWNSDLLQIEGLALTATRQPLFWIWPRQPRQFELPGFGCWALQRHDQPGLYYGFPGAVPGAAQAGVKFAHHHPGLACEPDEIRLDPDVDEYRRLRDAVVPFIPGLDGTVLAASTCMYTMSRDQHFIVDRHPDHANVTFAAGFSGHGFKFAPVIGELLADYALQDESQLPGEFLRIGERDLWDHDHGQTPR
jgi:sarcosine oxidase